jgi:hypothetical protein
MTLQISRITHLDAPTVEGICLTADLLLPGSGALPSWRAVEGHRDLIERVLDADPTLIEPVTRVARHACAEGRCRLEDLEEWAGSDVERVVFALNAAYYMAKSVRQIIGYPGQSRRPTASAGPDEVWTEELIAPVRARGPIYVATPEKQC